MDSSDSTNESLVKQFDVIDCKILIYMDDKTAYHIETIAKIFDLDKNEVLRRMRALHSAGLLAKRNGLAGMHGEDPSLPLYFLYSPADEHALEAVEK